MCKNCDKIEKFKNYRTCLKLTLTSSICWIRIKDLMDVSLMSQPIDQAVSDSKAYPPYLDPFDLDMPYVPNSITIININTMKI